MVYLLGGIVVVYVVAMAIGALTGRVRIRPCCGVSDPRCDPRLRAAASSDDGVPDNHPVP